MTQSSTDMTNHNRRQISIDILDNKKDVALEFSLTDGTISSFKFTLNDFTSFIRELGAVRQKMVAGKPAQSLEGAEIKTVFNTTWHIQPDIRTEGSALAFYHPAFGPVGVVFSKKEISDIVRLLSAHLRIQESVGGRPS